MVKKLIKTVKDASSAKGSVLKDAVSGKGTKAMSQGEINALIAKKAYELFEKRGYSHGRDQDDWWKAEKEVLSRYKTSKNW